MLVAEREIAGFFEEVAAGRDGKQVANWVTGTLFGALNRAGVGIEQSPVSAAALGALIDRVTDGTVSNRAAKDVFEAMVSTGKDADTIIEEQGLRQVSDTGAIEALVDQVIADNPDKVADYRGGKNEADGLVRRPGDEGVWRQGQSESGQRGAAGEARRLSAGPRRQVPTLSAFATRGHPQWGAAGGRRLAFDSIGTHVRRAGLRSEVGTRLPASPTPFGHPPNAR